MPSIPSAPNRVAILFSSFGPYHVARINALSDTLSSSGTHLVAFRFTISSQDYGWDPEAPRGIPIFTLSSDKVVGIRSSLMTAYAFAMQLRRNHVKAVFLPSYSPLPNFLCLLASKSVGCRTILMSESWFKTQRSNLLGRLLKHCIVRLFDSALVGGTPQRDYCAAYGMDRDKIFLGYDVVDVHHFDQSSQRWRLADCFPIPGLPSRYFLNLGRFVAKKNISALIRAYAISVDKNLPDLRLAPCSDKWTDLPSFDQHTIRTSVEGSIVGDITSEYDVSPISSYPSLVLVGEGPLREILEQQARSLGLRVRDGLEDPRCCEGPEVVFYPFQQVSLTPLFFSRCEAFILPSIAEEWGLVVNEAMASGAPVVVSSGVGSHFDMVQDGCNGYVFNPYDTSYLATLLLRFAQDPGLCRVLGDQGKVTSASWSPMRFGQSGFNALEAAFQH